MCIPLLIPDKEINCNNFLVGEQWFRIIVVSLTMIFEALFVHIADIHIDSDEFCRLSLEIITRKSGTALL